jgi:predicted peroxiredoxin
MVSGIVTNEDFLKTLKQHGVKIVGYNCGNLYYITQEDLIFDKHNVIGTRQFGNKHFDQMWTIPNYEDQLDFIESVTDTPCISVPYVWDTDFVIGEKYNPKRSKSNTYNIIILEANMNITKTCLIPLYICDLLFKNGYDITVFVIAKPSTESFKRLCSQFKFKIESYPRIISYEVLKQLEAKSGAMNIILSHQKDNPLNFLHLEMLYLDYPLVHNSEKIRHSGYYYSDIGEGARQVIQCINVHDNRVSAMRNGLIQENKEAVERFSTQNQDNIGKYRALIHRVLEQKFRRINVAYTGKTPYSQSLWHELSYAVHQHIPHSRHLYITEPFDFNDHELYILVGIHEFNLNALPKNYVLYNFEQLSARQLHAKKEALELYIHLMTNALHVWDYNKANVQYLKDHGYAKNNIVHVPFINNRLQLYHCGEKTFDVLFCGNYALRRIPILESCKSVFPDKLIIAQNIWGGQKGVMHSKSKIVLDIQMNEPKLSLNPYARYAYGFFYKCLIIAERTSDYKELEDYIVFYDTVDEMNDKIAYFLEHEEERCSIVEKAHVMWVNQTFEIPFII